MKQEVQSAPFVSLDPGQPHQHIKYVSSAPYIQGLYSVAILAVATAVISICAAVTAAVVSLRPILQNMARAVAATEKAAVEMEIAAKEWDRAALKFQAEVDLTMPEVAAASREFGALGRSVNTLGGLTTGGITGPMGLVQQTTSNSLRKVVNDVSQLTSALSPAMDDWRKRLSWMTQRVDALKNLNRPPPSQKEEVQRWISTWKQKSLQAQASMPTAQTLPSKKAAIRQQQRKQQATPGRAQPASPLAPLLSAFRENVVVASLDDDDDTDASFLAARSEARNINAAAEAAEEMATRANQMAADITASSPAADGAVHMQQERQQQARGAHQVIQETSGTALDQKVVAGSSSSSGQMGRDNTSSSTSSDPPLSLSTMAEQDAAILGRLKDRRSAAEEVYMALRRAEQAATAAAQASDVLENALQAAEHSGDFRQVGQGQQRYGDSTSRQEDLLSGYGSGSESGSEEGGKVSCLPLDGMAGSVGNGGM